MNCYSHHGPAQRRRSRPVRVGHVTIGGDAPIAASRTIVLTTRYTPTESGEIQLGFAGANPGRLFVDGELVLDESPVIEGTELSSDLRGTSTRPAAPDANR